MVFPTLGSWDGKDFLLMEVLVFWKPIINPLQNINYIICETCFENRAVRSFFDYLYCRLSPPHPSKTPIIPNTLKPKLFCIFNQYEWNRWWSILNVMFKSHIHGDSWTTLQSCKWSTLPIPLTTIVVNTTGHHCGLNYQIQLVNAKRTPKPSLISNLRWGYFPEQSQSLCCADSEACFNIDSNLTLLCMVLAFAIGHWWTNHWCKLRKPLIRFPCLSAKRQSIHHIEMPI